MDSQIKSIIKKKGMTQKELAEKLNMSIQQLNNTISGRNTASMAVFERIAEALDVEFWQLFAPEDVGRTIASTEPPVLTCPYCGKELKLTKAEENEH